MRVSKKSSGVRHLLNYLENHKGPRPSSSLKEDKELLFKEYRAGIITIDEYNKALEKLVME